MLGANIQHIVGLHQVQRMCIQYFSHSINIQHTVQVGARLANGTHQTGYKYTGYMVQLRWQDTSGVIIYTAKMTMVQAKKLCKTRTFISTSYQMH